MSASTLTVSGRSTPWYAYLIFDPWIGLSWLIFGFTGLLSVLMLVGPKPVSVSPSTTTASPSATRSVPNAVPRARVTFSQGLRRFLFTGYVFWSLYFGWAACCRFLVRSLFQRFNSWAAAGCMYMVTLGWLYFLLGAFYAWLGGGLYHFAKRWWLLAHGRHPAFLGPPSRTEAVEDGLARLDSLWRSGAISRPEYEQQRQEILRHI